MSTAHQRLSLSVTDYLEGEEVSSVKREFVDGVVYAMAGASVNHNRIATNATIAVGAPLRGQRCQVFNSDTKVRIRQSHSTRFYYPDLSIVCRPNPGTDSYHDEPVVIIEVISESTRRVDEFEKRDAYLSINSLSVYILLEPRTAAALAYRRIDHGFAKENYAGMDAIIPLPEIGCSLNLAECYANVDFLALTAEEQVQ